MNRQGLILCSGNKVFSDSHMLLYISDMMQQGLDLQVKPHIVISTPGRLADHLDSCDTFSLKRIKFLV